MRDHYPQVRLPHPLSEEWQWQLNGACRAMPSSIFFPDQSLRGHAKTSAEHDAKLVCAQCPVSTKCLQYALEARESHGIWGGLSSAERLRYIRSAAETGAPEPTRRQIGPPVRPYKNPRKSA